MKQLIIILGILVLGTTDTLAANSHSGCQRNYSTEFQSLASGNLMQLKAIKAQGDRRGMAQIDAKTHKSIKRNTQLVIAEFLPPPPPPDEGSPGRR